jgi:signal transduction histidine kinase
VYFRIYNPGSTPKKLVVHSPHIRSDGLDLYQWQQAAWQPIAQVERATPLTSRAFPFLSFGLPFTVLPHDTTAILLRSVRKTGLNELNLSVSEQKTYIENAITDNGIGAARITCFFMLTFILLVIGLLFRQNKMIYSGLFMASFSMSALCRNYYFDTLLFPAGLVLDASGVGSFFALTNNIFLHPYIYAIVKKSLTKPKQYLLGAGILILLNLIIVGVFLSPPTSQTNFIITNSFWILTGLNLMWLSYHALKVFMKSPANSPTKYQLGVFMLVFVPPLLQIILGVLGLNKIITIDVNYFDGFAMIFGMGYMAISQFKDDLMTKQALELGIDQVKQNMDLIRRAEIESVGRNLHDQVGNTLASALGYLNMKSLKTETAKELIMTAINELRIISHNLVKDDQRSLSEKVASLTDRLNDFATTNFIFDDFSEQKMDKLPQLAQQNIYAIIQELLTNILKHAQAQEVQVQFYDTEEVTLRIIVEDDGIGFDTQKVSGGIGLQNIRQRVALINAKLMTDSTPQGTTTILDLMP